MSVQFLRLHMLLAGGLGRDRARHRRALSQTPSRAPGQLRRFPLQHLFAASVHRASGSRVRDSILEPTLPGREPRITLCARVFNFGVSNAEMCACSRGRWNMKVRKTRNAPPILGYIQGWWSAGLPNTNEAIIQKHTSESQLRERSCE